MLQCPGLKTQYKWHVLPVAANTKISHDNTGVRQARTCTYVVIFKFMQYMAASHVCYIDTLVRTLSSQQPCNDVFTVSMIFLQKTFQHNGNVAF